MKTEEFIKHIRDNCFVRYLHWHKFILAADVGRPSRRNMLDQVCNTIEDNFNKHLLHGEWTDIETHDAFDDWFHADFLESLITIFAYEKSIAGSLDLLYYNSDSKYVNSCNIVKPDISWNEVKSESRSDANIVAEILDLPPQEVSLGSCLHVSENKMKPYNRTMSAIQQDNSIRTIQRDPLGIAGVDYTIRENAGDSIIAKVPNDDMTFKDICRLIIFTASEYYQSHKGEEYQSKLYRDEIAKAKETRDEENELH